MDIEAEEQLQEDIKNKLHKQMTPIKLWESRRVHKIQTRQVPTPHLSWNLAGQIP
jgi:hypothetical protein